MILTAPARVVLTLAALAACVCLPAYPTVEAQRQQENRDRRDSGRFHGNSKWIWVI